MPIILPAENAAQVIPAPLSADLLYQHVRADCEEDQVEVISAFWRALSYSEHYTQRFFSLKKRIWFNDCFLREIPLRGPVNEIESVKYMLNGDLLTLDPGLYRVAANDALVSIGGWPGAVDREPDAVQVTYLGGHSELPEVVVTAILLLVTHYFENRSAVDMARIELPIGVHAHLDMVADYHGVV